MATLLKVRRNTKGRDLVVGDLHGHLSQLRRQLEDIQFNPGIDRLFFLGDLVDRGPDSEDLLSMVDQRSCFSVIGNHEAMMIAGLEDAGADLLHRMNGGEWFYRLPAERQAQTVDRVRSWPWAIEMDTGAGRAGLVHANVPGSSWGRVTEQLDSIDALWQSGISLSDQAVDCVAKQLLWNRGLVSMLYSDILVSEENRQSLADHLLSRQPGEEWVARASPERLSPFHISDMDAVYMGHTYVPAAIHVGSCHFLDTYREEPGETLSIVCVNPQFQ
ncbi:metallophosphoesterase [Microbulbifer taiwanensis]|uniref:Metallophosphoesterase n=1 Tax=Microbulbifer taiwanensis TaxID=986746 RepID=A0ABW1YIB0_9GAMM|nr:metallophosphoesterase [Microbulbifer taiwanensis]